MISRLMIAGVLTMSAAAATPAGAAEPWSSPEEARQNIETCLRARVDSEAQCLDAVVTECLAVPTNQTTAGMIGCSAVALEGWDLILNSTYRSIMSSAGDGLKTALRNAQRNWISYRDSKCAVWRALYEGGSMGRLIGADCMRDETARRVLDLREIAAHEAL